MAELNWKKVETIIDRALELPDNKRLSFVDKQCAGNIALKSEVTLLLESIFESEGWLDNSDEYKELFSQDISEDIEQITSKNSLVGQAVGSYTIVQELGEGGMGSVYLAERSDGAFDHRVAIKVIRQGRASRENILRFEQERRILADLNHRGIAKLFDGGITEDGFPYLIMEYIDGIPVTQYCEQSALPLQSRINLFKKILKAVRHAHENAIIHRDLKPGNILVTKKGEVKILDFGISKMLDDESSGNLTQTKARLLTPRYAAPEQIKQQRVTTATDLYALGIIFYQLLCGEHPLELKGLPQYEMEQVILGQEPPSPSTKVTGSFCVTKNQLKGDLDAIALKAVRKEPAHRYRMANEFLEDLHNYQKGLPVSAREDSIKYRTQKFYKRHTPAIVVAASVLLLIIGFAGVYSWRITEERNKAQLEARRAEQVKEFMLGIFDETNPELAKSLKKDLSAKQLLRSGIEKVEQELQEQPQIYTEMLSSISRALMSLDDYKSANAALQKALNKSQNAIEGGVTTASLYIDLTELKLYQGKVDSANYFGTKAKNISHSLQPIPTSTFINAKANHIYALTKAFQAKYDSSVVYYLKADSLYKKAGQKNTVEYIENLKGLGEILNYKGDFKQSEKYLQKALKAFQEKYNRPHLNTLSAKSQIGNLYRKRGQHQKAQRIFSETLQETIMLLGKNNYEVAKTYHRIAANYVSLAEYDSAVIYSQRALDIYYQIYDNNTHTNILSSLNNLALAKDYQGKRAEAIKIYRDIISKKEKKNGKDHPKNAIAMYNLATILQINKSYQEAYGLMQRVLRIQKKSLGKNHPYISLYYIKLGSLQRDLKLYGTAGQSFQKAKAIINSELPKDHYRVGTYYYHLGLLNKDQRKFQKAAKNLEKAFNIYEASFGAEHANTKEVQAMLKEVRKISS